MKRTFLIIVLCFIAHPVFSQWDGTSEPWTQGNGTQSNPYQISTPGMLAYLSDMVNAGISTYSGQYFLLTQDISLSNQPWTPIGNNVYTFQGHFDGGGHTIDSMNYSGSLTYSGLFGYIINATLCNCSLYGRIYGTAGGYSGGFVGCARGSNLQHLINYCNIITINGSATVGGIAGYSSGTIVQDCLNYGTIEHTSTTAAIVGGILGRGSGFEIRHCTNHGTIVCGITTSSGIHVGGICGEVYSSSSGLILCCNNTGAVTVGTSGNYVAHVSGILGFTSSSNTVVKYCYNTAGISKSPISNGYVSGIVYGAGVQYCYNTGTLSGNLKYGTGSANGPTSNSYYLNTCGASQGGVSRTESQMRSPSFPVMLNADSTVFIMDLLDENDGYPVFLVPANNVTTDSANNISSFHADVNGHFNGVADTVGFIYGRTSGNTSTTQVILSITTSPCSYTLIGLQPNTQYRYSFFVKYNGSYIYGDTLTFTTRPTYTVTASSNNSTWGSVTGGGTYGYGDSCILVAVPDSHRVGSWVLYHYNFVQWSDGNTENPRTITVLSDTALTAQFAIPNCTLTVTPNNPLWGTVSGGGIYPAGSTYILAAIPSTGYHFSEWVWSDSGRNRENPLTGNIWNDMSYEAYFSPNRYTVTVQANDSTMGYVEGGGTYDYNHQTYIIARPYGSYLFTQWSDGDTNPYRIITVTHNVTYTAYFTDVLFNITAQGNNAAYGYVTGGGSYARGSQATLTAIPNVGYHFTQWSDGNMDNPRTVTVTSDATYTAQFAVNTYVVNISSSNPAMGSATGSGIFNHGANTTIEATPMPHYRFVQWNDGNNANPRAITVTSDSNFVAQFEQQEQYTITVVSDSPQQGSVSGGGTFYAGEQTVISATAAPNNSFSRWSDGNTEALRTITVIDDATYTAYFSGMQYTVNVYSNDDNMGSVAGGGSYVYGEYATVTATPLQGFRFVRWNNGVEINPYTFQVYDNVNLIANFERNTAIDGVAIDELCIKTQGKFVTVAGVDGMAVSITDMLGRTIYKTNSYRQEKIAVPANGVYMIRIGDSITQKIILFN